jgi:hypothetical protein
MAAEPQEHRFEGVHCAIIIQHWPGGVVNMRISGRDVGEFGTAPLEKLDTIVAAERELKLYIDARDSQGASLEVSGDYANWLRRNKATLKTITMLTGSKMIELTANFVRRFAGLEDTMTIITDPADFEQQLLAQV